MGQGWSKGKEEGCALSFIPWSGHQLSYLFMLMAVATMGTSTTRPIPITRMSLFSHPHRTSHSTEWLGSRV